MIENGTISSFLHNAHIFSSAVREILEERYLRRATDLDISLPHFNLLKLIDYNGDHQIKEIASFFGVSQAAASKTVEKMVRLGMVNREVQPEDRRAISLSLTNRARHLIQKYETLKEESVREVLSQLDPDELSALTRGLEKVGHLIFEKEPNVADVCMKCSAYNVERCPLQSLSDGCIYIQTRKQAIH
jgi:DNA-binding MarR family transcriptional regulator